MKSILRVVLSASVLLLPISSEARIQEGTFEVGAYGGYNIFENDKNLADAPIIGGRLGYNFTRHWGLEVGAQTIRTHVDDRTLFGPMEGQFRSPIDRVRMNLYYADVLYHFQPEARFNPFLLAGLGGATHRPTISTVDDMGVVNFGGGAKYWLTDHLAFRVDVKDHMVTEFFQESYHNLATTAGFSFAFGGRRPRAVAQAAPATEAPYYAPRSRFMGPAGPQGPTGPTGVQGPTGYTGAPSLAMAGPRGAQGPSGPRGVRGPTGATGSVGGTQVGPAGVAGATGFAGSRGERGWTGAQGVGSPGYAGPTGPAGPTGIQGDRGATGFQGSTLVGPSGPEGAQGPSGAQGTRGEIGFQGSTTAGVSGPSGVSGPTGPQGEIGWTGAQGPAGRIERWTSYRDLWFEIGEGRLRTSEYRKISEIAEYVRRNPSLELGIDIFRDRPSQDLRDARVESVRAALIQAGVPSAKIRQGAWGDPDARRDARVEILIQTTQN